MAILLASLFCGTASAWASTESLAYIQLVYIVIMILGCMFGIVTLGVIDTSIGDTL